MPRLEWQIEGGVAHVRLARPDRRNAIDIAMWDEIADVFVRLGACDSVRCILFGSVTPAVFSVGADLAEFRTARTDAAGARAYEGCMRRAIDAVRECRHPVVSRLSGLCLGGGIELALLTDLRIASTTLRCGIPVNRTGQWLPPADLAGLVTAVGLSVAKELILEGRILDADDACARGIVSRVVPPERLNEEVEAAVARIAAGSPGAARWHKRVLNAAASGDPDPGDLADVYRSADSPDYREGLAAFFDKRAPVFPA